ncbi:hypothetical protein GCM10022243_57910 [Saccharothrix violaceirubra]
MDGRIQACECLIRLSRHYPPAFRRQWVLGVRPPIPTVATPRRCAGSSSAVGGDVSRRHSATRFPGGGPAVDGGPRVETPAACSVRSALRPIGGHAAVISHVRDR